MKAQHTPGEWTTDGQLETLRVINANSRNPKSCDNVRQICTVTQGDYEIPNYEEAKANALLISAAPDMYNALMFILSGSELTVSDAREVARTAINKATGRE